MKYIVDSIIFDFDGVLVESNHIRTNGFRELLKDFDPRLTEQFIRYHECNNGLSRYYKLRYFYENILKKDITQEKLLELCNRYSDVVKKQVIKCDWVIGAYEFILRNHKRYKLFIVSGSDQKELQDIVKQRGIDSYFHEILGSPEVKSNNIQFILSKYLLKPSNVLFVGDSINDLEAARSVHIKFIARDSGDPGNWRKNIIVIDNLSQLSACIEPLKKAVCK